MRARMRVRAGGSGRVQAPPTLYAHKTYGRSFSGVLATGSMPRLLTVLKLPIYCPGVCVCVCLCVCVCVYLHMSPFSRVHPCTPDSRKHVNNQQAFRTALTGLVRHVFALRFRLYQRRACACSLSRRWTRLRVTPAQAISLWLLSEVPQRCHTNALSDDHGRSKSVRNSQKSLWV